MDFDLIIVGAGMGAAAALESVSELNLRIAVIDKARSVGGRCATRRTDASPDAPWLDSGAQYFTARSAAFQQHVANWSSSGWLQPWSPRIARLGDNGLIHPSPDQQTRWIAPSGMNQFVRQLLAEHSAQTQIVTSTRITRARLDAGMWQLQDEHAGQWRCKRLLITAPPAQTRDLLGDELATHVPDVHMQPCLAALARTSQPVAFDALFGASSHASIAWAANNLSKLGSAPQAGLWTIHAHPHFSLAQSPPQDAAQQLCAHFAELCELPTKAMELVHHHVWRYARPAQAQFHQTPTVLLTQQLALAGDWMNGGRIEGAWLSGRNAALALYSDRSAARSASSIVG